MGGACSRLAACWGVFGKQVAILDEEVSGLRGHEQELLGITRKVLGFCWDFTKILLGFKGSTGSL